MRALLLGLLRVLGLLMLAQAPTVQAATVSFSFGGFVLTASDTHGVLDGSIVPMTRITGHVEYDTLGSTDIFDADPTLGLYFQNPPMGQLRVHIGTYALEVPMEIPVRFMTSDDFRLAAADPFMDRFDWRMEGDTFPFPGTASSRINQMIFSLRTADTSVLLSDALPTAPLDIADFPNPDLTFFIITGCLTSELSDFFCTPESIQIFGTIDMLPEPGDALSGLAALAVLAAIARGRSSHRPSRSRRLH